MKQQTANIFFLVFTAFGLFYACGGPQNAERTDTPTSGEVNIVVDESFARLFDTQIYTFESIYKNAKIFAKYLPEDQALERMINDSCKVVVMCRDLTENERKQFEQKNIFPKSTKIAEDAIAFIIHPDNTDSLLSVGKIKSILKGNDSLWSQLNSKSNLGKINIVFDNKGSANARYMQDTVLKGESFGKNVFAVNSNPEVIEYVSKNKNAIGILSVNWISDLDDPRVQTFLSQVKVVEVSKQEGESGYKPYQAYIKTKEYAFTRSVYMINRQTRAGLGMGIVSFVAGDKGQLMILKAGLVPAIAPIRMVTVKME
ncbi:MAG: substrate-binding domain-containing protein [Bacteroidia bacterium]|nr:substrate-binding domain-containing protein [Bacteroidia bacterium]